MNTDKAIEILNGLIQINNDRIEGYQKAMDETDENDLQLLFNEFVITSKKLNEQLIDEVEDMDGEVVIGTSSSGKLYRIWMDIKSAITSRDRLAILDSCDFGEDWVVRAYEKVMHDDTQYLSIDQNEIIRDQYTIIRNDHDTIKQLRDHVGV